MILPSTIDLYVNGNVPLVTNDRNENTIWVDYILCMIFATHVTIIFKL